MSERLRLSLVSGFPVEFSDSNRINSQRFFYGTSADFGPFLERWDVQLFAIRQELHGVEDRSAIGGQIRYTGGQSFALALVDYDVSYSALNTLMFISNWRLGESTNISVSADRRKSPILTTRNAIQGQPVEDFDDLEALFDEEQIRDLAEDRTADSSTATLGISHRFSSGWQIAGNVSVSNLSDTPASGVVPATPGTDNEYNFSLRATGTDLIVDGSFTTFGLRFANADTNDRYSATVASRYRLLDGLRLGPVSRSSFAGMTDQRISGSSGPCSDSTSAGAPSKSNSTVGSTSREVRRTTTTPTRRSTSSTSGAVMTSDMLPPTELLTSVGVEVETKHGTP